LLIKRFCYPATGCPAPSVFLHETSQAAFSSDVFFGFYPNNIITTKITPDIFDENSSPQIRWPAINNQTKDAGLFNRDQILIVWGATMQMKSFYDAIKIDERTASIYHLFH
jgi:hypothetical protein